MTEQPPGVYPPPPVQGSGYPPPAPGYSGASSIPGTNGLAIASFVCSFLGGASGGIGAIVGIVLGVIALNQIKKSGQGGRGLALAGITVGAVWLVIGAIGFIAYFSTT